VSSRTFTDTQRLSWCRYLSIHVRRTFQLVRAWLRIAPQPALSRLKSVDAINALPMARCSHATPCRAHARFPSATLIRLYEFLKNNSLLSKADLKTRTCVQILRSAFHEEHRRSSSVAATPLNCVLIMNWWRMTGSNRRPPACKAGALPAELIPLLDDRWWVWLDSNQRPPPYQDGALTD
jgi:hypothetical protein